MSRPDKMEDWSTDDLVEALMDRYRDTSWPFYKRVALELRLLQAQLEQADLAATRGKRDKH